MTVGFNADFGMNVKKYQLAKGSTFSKTFTNSSIQSKWDSSVFTNVSNNPFRGGASLNISFNQLKTSAPQQRAELWDRLEAKAMQNAQKANASIQQGSTQQTGSGGAKGILSGINSLADAIGSTFKKKDSTSADGKAALDKMNQAGSIEELKPAVDQAVTEQKNVQRQETQSNNDVKVANKDADNARKSKMQTEENVNQSQETLETNKGIHDETKNKVQQAQDKLTNATNNVKNAEQALDAARSAATAENPNTAAINKAQADLRAAQQEEAQAKKDLEAAKQEEAQASEAVDQSETQVNNAEQQDSNAANQVETTEAQADDAIQTNKEVTQTNQEMTAGIEDGKQKLDQMEGQTADATSETANNPSEELQNAGISQGTGALEQRNGQYYCNGYQVSEAQYKAAQSMDQNVVNAGFSPGSTTDVYVNGSDDPKTFTVQEGKYLVNGQEVDSNTFLQEYNSAKANEESGTGQDISLINDDYSKYSSPQSAKEQSIAHNDTPAVSSGNYDQDSLEAKNGTVDENFKAKMEAQEALERSLIRSKSGHKIKS